ncbi:MAG: N-acetylmuramoyl-L-alanine amidase [Rhodoblastus sp.]
MFEVVNHILHQDGRPVAQRPSPNHGGVMRGIDFLIMHYTGALSAAGAINTLTSPAAKVSAHFVIGPDGAVTQLLPCNFVGWHAGVSSWKGRSGCNAFTIGIELANPGLLQRTGAGGFATRLEHKPVDPANVILAEHKNGGGVQPWAAYPEEQMRAAIAVAMALNAAYKFKDVLGHDDIAPHRKTDPGPAFPMAAFKSRVLGRADAPVKAAAKPAAKPVVASKVKAAGKTRKVA